MMCNDCQGKFVIKNLVYLKICTKNYLSGYTYDSVLCAEFMPDWVRIVHVDDDGLTVREDIFPRTEIIGVYAKTNNENLKVTIDSARKEAYML